MRSGYAPQTTGVPVGTVTVDGVAREAVSVSTVREMGGGGVPGVSASAAAEGSVSFGHLKNADSGPVYSPWTRTGNWPPAPGSAVQVDTGARLEAFRMLTGVIDSSSAGSDGVVSSSIIDPVDRLHRRINLPAYLYSMPPATEGGVPLNVGMSSDWVADIVLRRCAYFTTPYMGAAFSGVNVPGTGSMIPERGTVTAAGRYENTSFAAQFLGSDWGWGIYSADATYTTEGTLRASTGFTIATMVGARHENIAQLIVAEGAGTWTLRVNANRSLDLLYDGATVVSLSASNYRRVEARISAGSVALVTDDGRNVSGAHPAPSVVTGAAVDSVRIAARAGSSIGGVMVSNMGANLYLNYSLNARIVGGTTLNPSLLASPRVDNRDALDVLSEIAQATCRAFWWDEDGVFQWWPGDVLLGRTPGLTLTSTDSLIDLGWSEGLADTYRAAVVDHKVPGVTRSRTPNVTVWQGKGDSLESGQYAEEIASPSTDEEWIQTQWSPTNAGGSFMNEHNHGRRSVWGGVRTDGTVTQWAGSALTLGFQPVGNVAMKYTYEAGVLPTGTSIQLAFPNDATSSALWMRWRNEKLPLLRAYGRVSWADGTAAAGSGPVEAAEYRHDAGKWAQGVSGETPGRIAAFLAEWLCVPRAKATGVRVVHDPRIQVGDVHLVRDEHAHGVELKVLVTRVAQSVSVGEQSMELDFFVIDGKAALVTLAQHDASQAGKTLTQHDASEPGETLAGHDADPLHTA